MVRLARSAENFLDRQSVELVSQIIDEVGWLTDNPELTPDDPRKRPFVASPVLLRIFHGDVCWIIYYWSTERNDWIIANIGNEDEEPHLLRER